jgi:hypothetical protein
MTNNQKLITNLKALEFQFEALKEKLKNEGISFKKSKEYYKLYRAVSRCQKKIEGQETTFSKTLPKVQKNSSPANAAELSKKNQGENLQKININLINTNSEEQAFSDFWLETDESKSEKMSKQAMLKGKKTIFKISPFANDTSMEEAKIPYLNRVVDKFTEGFASSLIDQNRAITTFLNCRVDDFNAVNIYNSELLNDMMGFHYDFRRFEKDEQRDDDYVSYEEPYVRYRRHPVMIAFQNYRLKLYTNSVLFPEKVNECRYPLMVIRHKIYILKRIFVEISRQLELLFGGLPGSHGDKRYLNPNRPPLVLRPVINTVSDTELDKVYEEYWKNYKKPSLTKEELLEIEQTREDDLWFDQLRKRDRTLQTVYEVERIKGFDKFFL